MEDLWKGHQLNMKTYKENYNIITDVDEVTTQLEESIMIMNNLLANKFIGNIRGKVKG